MGEQNKALEYNICRGRHQDETWFWNHIQTQTETINYFPKETRPIPAIAQNFPRDRDKSLIYFSLKTEK